MCSSENLYSLWLLIKGLKRSGKSTYHQIKQQNLLYFVRTIYLCVPKDSYKNGHISLHNTNWRFFLTEAHNILYDVWTESLYAKQIKCNFKQR